MDTLLMSFVITANYIKEGKIYRIYFECRNGNLELSVDSDAGRILWRQEAIFVETFTVEGYLNNFFSGHSGRIEYQSESSLEEDIKQMIMAYGRSSFGTWRHPSYNWRVIDAGENNGIADMITNSYRDMMLEETMGILEQMVSERRNELMEEREEDEDRR